ncbi:MAG: DUF3857 and transglutaminase domain-containing protein [Acidobacteria bacterium]|nr:DUF3857 and transglutaminase domain-containing protein [Acidobacteriota bacterium]
MTTQYACLRIISVLCLLWCSASLVCAQDWKPIDPAHVALKAPTIDKEADAEGIFWEIKVQDETGSYGPPQRALYNYARIKIFTERGVEKHGKVDLTYYDFGYGASISSIAARTIKPDGTIVEMKKDAVFDREVVKMSGIKVKAKNFALPAVTPGSIIEYRWKESRPAEVYMRLALQREYPIQQVMYYVKPGTDIIVGDKAAGMKSMTFHGQTTPFARQPNGFHLTTASNVPAFKEEARMPPEDQIKTWMLLYYSSSDKKNPMEYWKMVGKQNYDYLKGMMKVNDDVRKAAATIIGDAATDDDKLQRLLTFVRTKIRNAYADEDKVTDEERKKLKERPSPADTLKASIGNNTDIDMLFASLATAAGFEARIISLPDRSDIFFDPNFPDDYFLRTRDVAIKSGDKWKIIDPSSKYVPFGMLRWEQEGVQGLLADPKEPGFISVNISPAQRSLTKRTAKLKMTEDGSLTGTVRVEFNGHPAAAEKEMLDDKSASEREEYVSLRWWKSRLAGVEVTDIQLENVTDPFKPLAYSCKVSVPGYAERTGKRLFVQPAFFQKNIAAMFSTGQREHAIYFNYPWLEEDSINIELPEGWALDNPEAPANVPLGNAGDYKVRLAMTKDAKTLIYERTFKFEGLLFQKDVYPALKQRLLKKSVVFRICA